MVGKADVGFYDKERPGMGQAAKGQLILTNRRLVYIKYPGGKFLRAKVEDYSNRIEEGLKNEGSLEIPLGRISEAKAERIWGTGYLRVSYRTDSDERACSFILTSMWTMWGIIPGKAPYEEVAQRIEQLRKEASTS